MKSSAVLIIAAAACGTAALAQPAAPPPPGEWRATTHAMGTAYETGTFDRPVDAGLRIACTSEGAATMTVQVKGMAPAAGATFLLIPAARRSSQTFSFTAGTDRDVAFAHARNDRQLGRLWAALRGGTSATLRYPDGSFGVLSLVGANRTLPRRVCGTR